MYHTAILNPALNQLLGCVRHTNRLVIADKGFPFWPDIPTVDISLVNDQPSVADVLRALIPHFTVGIAWMATEFHSHNPAGAGRQVQALLGHTPITFLPHNEFKQLVSSSVALVRTGGTAPYSNILLESA